MTGEELKLDVEKEAPEEEEIFVPTYELDICERDGAGNPTGRRKRYKTHKPSSLAWWFFKNSSPPPRRNKKKSSAPRKNKTLQRKKKLDGTQLQKSS